MTGLPPVIDEYLHRLSRALHGPRRLKADLLTEARHGLDDAAADYRAAGLPEPEAQRRAVAEFGSVPEIAAAYQVELAALTARRLSVRILGVWLLLLLAADRMWQGAPWDGGTPPPAGYRLLSTSLTWAWTAAGVTAGAAYLHLTWTARRGRAGGVWANRLVGRGLSGWLLLGAGLGTGLFIWSLALWDAARTWPPMLIGMSAVALAHAWLGWTARDCLLATAGPVGALRREPRWHPRPGSAQPWR